MADVTLGEEAGSVDPVVPQIATVKGDERRKLAPSVGLTALTAYMDRKLQKLKVVIQEQAREVKEAANKLAGAVGSLANQAELAMGRNRNVVIKGIPEPFCISAQQKVGELRQRVVALLRDNSSPSPLLWKGSCVQAPLEELDICGSQHVRGFFQYTVVDFVRTH
ncbi:unnamed protein product [Echinostoma caproni]|uniref:t-SNARE coiled-coil homology domain-containing protein n=1 Tax=Echinostoma caproni TaxID=27848 RepID=A0A183B7X0_9TREM|nr:unnamed protein product [Echinostoma caproni]